MNGDPHIPAGYEDDDALAAEYVLGVLDRAERTRAQTRIGSDPAFARLVGMWEERLSGLDDDFAEVPPPRRVKTALDRRLFGTPQPSALAAPASIWSSLAFWRIVSGAALVGLAFLAAVILRTPTGVEGERLIALMSAEKGDKQFVALYDPARGSLRVSQIAGGKPIGRDEELWLIQAGKPVSLGLIGVSGAKAPSVPRELTEAFSVGATLAVSDEPLGGSPTGQPTGEVVAAGPLKIF
jgi:anti-sigma-K factor RskA